LKLLLPRMVHRIGNILKSGTRNKVYSLPKKGTLV